MVRYKLLIFLLLFPPVCVAQDNATYVQPLKSAYRISGTFAELRLGHFHAGIDMGTAGVEDLEVHAAQSGYVSRVKVGPFGYGRTLYIDHPDGHTTVYGHLNGYVAKIDSVVRRHQYAARSFSVEFYPPPGSIPVHRDEVVAYSGNTGGSGGPHLHFEVRDTKSEQPLNPLRFISIDVDTVPPTLYGVKLYPLDAESGVDGAATDKYYDLSSIANKEISVCGTIGVGFYGTDYVAVGGRPCGIIEVSLFDNETLVYQSRVDSISFDTNIDVNSHIDFADYKKNRRFIQRCFVSPGNRMEIYGERRTPTIVREGERHRMRLVLRDFAGNTTEAVFSLVGKTSAAAQSFPVGDMVRRAEPWLKLKHGLRVSMPAETLFDDTYIDVRRTNTDDTPRYVVGSVGMPLRGSITLSLPVPDKWSEMTDKVFVYSINGKWIGYLGGCVGLDEETEEQMVVTAQSATLGTFSLDVDTVPPTVSMRNKNNRVRRNKMIYIGVADDKSGILSYDVRVDGRWEVFEFDYKKKRLKASPSYLGLSIGRHTLEVTVGDCRGNTTKKEWSITVVK